MVSTIEWLSPICNVLSFLNVFPQYFNPHFKNYESKGLRVYLLCFFDKEWVLMFQSSYKPCLWRNGRHAHLLFIGMIGSKFLSQSADTTAWTGVLMVFNYYSWYCVNANQLPIPTFWYLHECQNSLIQCSTSKVIVSIQIPWIYSSLLWTTETVQHTSAQSIGTFSALILARD